jgi:hypothetical protein
MLVMNDKPEPDYFQYTVRALFDAITTGIALLLINVQVFGYNMMPCHLIFSVFANRLKHRYAVLGIDPLVQ